VPDDALCLSSPESPPTCLHSAISSQALHGPRGRVNKRHHPPSPRRAAPACRQYTRKEQARRTSGEPACDLPNSPLAPSASHKGVVRRAHTVLRTVVCKDERPLVCCAHSGATRQAV
jgi:hypothetical protein